MTRMLKRVGFHQALSVQKVCNQRQALVKFHICCCSQNTSLFVLTWQEEICDVLKRFGQT